MKKHLVNWKEFQGLVSQICTDIERSKWVPDYIVGITRGGLTPAVMISHWIGKPCETLKVSLRDDGQCESNLWMPEDAASGKNILIVDDINDSGATINWIVDDWQSSFQTNWTTIWGERVKFACVFDNAASGSVVRPSYVGRTINKTTNPVWLEFPYESAWVDL